VGLRPKSGQLAAMGGRAWAGGRPASPWASVGALGWGREGAGEGAHRRSVPVAAASHARVRQELRPAGEEAR
jgi:hypothetical protein